MIRREKGLLGLHISGLVTPAVMTPRVISTGFFAAEFLMVPHGQKPQEENQDDKADRGFLFVCYQRDLSQQFACVENQFIKNTPPHDDPNPLNLKPHDNNIKNLLRSEDLEIGLRNWITTTGGEWFSSPSICAFKELKTHTLNVG